MTRIILQMPSILGVHYIAVKPHPQYLIVNFGVSYLHTKIQINSN